MDGDIAGFQRSHFRLIVVHQDYIVAKVGRRHPATSPT